MGLVRALAPGFEIGLTRGIIAPMTALLGFGIILLGLSQLNPFSVLSGMVFILAAIFPATDSRARSGLTDILARFAYLLIVFFAILIYGGGQVAAGAA